MNLEDYKPITDISKLLGEEYLKQFKVVHSQTLFPPVWENLLNNRCPLCNCKLYYPRNSIVAYCKSVKHKSFAIKVSMIKDICQKQEVVV